MYGTRRKCRYNKKSRKYLIKNKKTRKHVSKRRKQKGGTMSLMNNPLIWTFQDIGNNLMHGLSGTAIPASSKSTIDQFEYK